MDTRAQPLVLRVSPGGAVSIVAPVPGLTVLSLCALASASLREWVVVEDDGYTLDVCGHRFGAVGWLSTLPPGVVLEHRCCADA